MASVSNSLCMVLAMGLSEISSDYGLGCTNGMKCFATSVTANAFNLAEEL